MADRVEVLWSGGSPVEYLGDPHLAAALPQADARGGGVGQDVAADRLLGVGLKSETSKRLKQHRTGREEAGLLGSYVIPAPGSAVIWLVTNTPTLYSEDVMNG